MKYYKVKKTMDVFHPVNNCISYYPFIKDELYTERELEKLGFRKGWDNFEAVEISRKKTFRFFGARFAS